MRCAYAFCTCACAINPTNITKITEKRRIFVVGMKIFAVIVTFNAMKWIEKTLRCIGESSVPMEVVIVDNASSDDTVKWLSEHSKATIIRSERNLGFGAANNIGMKYALEKGATHALLVNQDAYIAPDMLERLLECENERFEKGLPKAILSPVHFNGDHSAIDQNFEKNSYRKDVSEPYETRFVNAALWLLPSALIEKVGFFSPAFFHYGEDENYCNRVRFEGFGIVVVPGAEVCHDRGKYGNPRLAAKSLIPNKLVNIHLDPNLSRLQRLGRYLIVFAESIKKCLPGAFARGVYRILTLKK